MDGMTCCNCDHYIQHYALKGGRLYRVHCGHCTHARVRRKQPDTPACENFREGETDDKAFVSKHYLTKELLRFVLEMELLPEINDYPDIQHS